jgi:hypothetical protein
VKKVTAALAAAFVFLGAGALTSQATSHQLSPGCYKHNCTGRVCKSNKCQARVAAKRARARIASDPWAARFAALPAAGKAWTRSTAICESGHNPPINVVDSATGHTFYGMFQWVPSTWYNAGGTGSPMNASFEHQAVIAWCWHVKNPHGQWPVCGE